LQLDEHFLNKVMLILQRHIFQVDIYLIPRKPMTIVVERKMHTNSEVFYLLFFVSYCFMASSRNWKTILVGIDLQHL